MTIKRNFKEDMYTLFGESNLKVTFYNLAAIFALLLVVNWSGF